MPVSRPVCDPPTRLRVACVARIAATALAAEPPRGFPGPSRWRRRWPVTPAVLAALAALLAAGAAGCGAGSLPGSLHDDDAGVTARIRALLPPGATPTVCTATWAHVDGDGFRCAAAGTVRVVRIAAIDAPEIGQAFATEARRRLATLTPAGTVVACHGRDRHDRHLCRVFDPRGVAIAPVLLAEGLAWHAAHFGPEQTTTERSAYAGAMAEARAARRGLWSRPDPMPPWTCRDRMANGQSCR